MVYPSLITLFFMALISSSAFANCDSVLALAGQNVNIKNGSVAVLANKYARACFHDWSKSDNATVGRVDVEVFGMGAGGGDLSTSSKKERLINWCDTNKSLYSNNQALYEESKTVYGDSVSAWKSCKEIEAQSIQLNPIVHADMLGVDFLLRTSDGSRNTFKGVFLRGFTCKAKTSSNEGKLSDVSPDMSFELSDQGIPISCTRNEPQALTLDGQRILKYPAGSITLSHAGKNFNLQFVEKQDPELTEAEKKILKGSIQKLETEISVLRSDLDAMRKNAANLDTRLLESRKDFDRQLAGFVALKVVSDGELERSCKNNDLACLASANTWCSTVQGYQGGVPQHWANGRHTILCVGKK